MNVDPGHIVQFLSERELPQDQVVGVDKDGRIVEVDPGSPEAARAEAAYCAALKQLAQDNEFYKQLRALFREVATIHLASTDRYRTPEEMVDQEKVSWVGFGCVDLESGQGLLGW